MNWDIRRLVWTSGIHKTGLGFEKHLPRSVFIGFTIVCKCKCRFCTNSFDVLCISMIPRVLKRRETLFGVDLSKIFGVNSVLDLFGERNDVFKYRQLSMHQFLYLILVPIYLFVYLPIYLSISIYLLSVPLSIHLSTIYPSIYLLYIYLCIYL